MHRRKIVRIIATCLAATLVTLGSVSAQDQTSTAPDAVDLKDINIKIVEALYITELRGVKGSFKQKQPEKYRGLVLIVELEKPAGSALTLYAQDFSLHYYYGKESSDVAPCQGISGFSTTKDTDRPMAFDAQGRQASQTGVATTGADTVYVDLFFDFLEPDTREFHLLLAQPVIIPYATSGWTK